MSSAPQVEQVAVRPIDVVGVGADGWDGLPPLAREVLRGAGAVVGGPRQLALLPPEVTAEQVELPSPLLPALDALVASLGSRRAVVLASGDPMFFGIGATLARAGVPITVHPMPSSVSLACARLGWAAQDVDVVSLVGRPAALLRPALQPGRRVLALVATPDGRDSVQAIVDGAGFEASRLQVLTRLGAADETVSSAAGPHDPLAIVAIECLAADGTTPLPRTPGLPDDAFEHDGQITKREIRALVLAALAPVPGQLLWDVGAGSGSVGIEWMRVHPASRAIAIEPRDDRADRVGRNAEALGVPGLDVVRGGAPDALAGLPAPDAVFVGGGVSRTGVLDACVTALRPGGRLVANGVTVETEGALASWHARLGGTLTRLSVERAAPIGGFTGWQPGRAVTQWAWTKPAGWTGSTLSTESTGSTLSTESTP